MANKKIDKVWEALGKIVEKRNITIYTATQPPRPDCGHSHYNPPTGNEIVVVDYVGHILPKDSV